MLGSCSLLLLALVGSKLSRQAGSASCPADAGWDAARGSGEAWDGGGGTAWSLRSFSPGPTMESSPGTGQQSPSLGTFLRGRSAPLSCLARGFCWRLSGSSKFGRNHYHFCWERWQIRQPRCYGCRRPSSVQHHVKQLCRQMCRSWKAKLFPRCQHGVAGHTHCPLCSRGLPWDAGCALGCVSLSLLSRTLRGSRKPTSDSSAGEGEAWHLQQATPAGV